ncbi:phosphoinositide phosphatase SAC3-like isoform X3 [Andrographis paniculata]|uniref:phosphoinositide phosphatase SAC3-like isoform X3 n=1 Tax=Andrographis paniculata TaxID=175694 RepID=UPI0021E96679|nr:phosphoinositide phosphatase SAC3-like isoform X3 [Andrographis paniculata]
MADVLGNNNSQNQNHGIQPTSPPLSQDRYLQKFRLYKTQANFYMVGRDKSRTHWKVLKIDRSEPTELNIQEDSTIYSEDECSDLLKMLHEGNTATGGLKFITTCYGIVGPYYMLLITKRKQIGVICGHNIYAVSKIELIPVPHPNVRPQRVNFSKENRYKKLLCMVDLTKDFFFSYSYNIMRSLQKNTCDKKTGKVLYETMFVWNEFLTRGIRNLLPNTLWTVALVYGFFKQTKLSLSGRDFQLTLIARRSRHYAGTRYLKRGVNEKGRVANDVETEQIVAEDVPEGEALQISSVVQNRGSIPLFWSQETSRLNLKPDIILSKRDQNYEATRLHFEHLTQRYGSPIIILNLIKANEKKPRESILRTEFVNAIAAINQDLPEEKQLKFVHLDLHKLSRSSKATNVLELLGMVATYALLVTGLFYCQLTPTLLSNGYELPSFENVDTPDISPTSSNNDIEKRSYEENEHSDDSNEKSSEGNSSIENNRNPYVRPPLIQSGVLRTNCIDCLDRTNVAQYAYGLVALGSQLYALGVTTSPHIELDDPLAEELMSYYERMGDTLAHQYGGSAAHNKIFSERRGQWKAAIQSQEFLRTLQRYYSNAYMDAEKQNAINVFLGHFQPEPDKADLWELDSDQHYVGRNGELYIDEDVGSFFKRSWSDGQILRKNTSPSSALNINKGFPGAAFPSDARGQIKMLFESTPEISTSGSKLACSRYPPLLPSRQNFLDIRRIGYFEHDIGEGNHRTNFVDLDWLSSSGNLCEEELLERSLLTASPTAVLSSEIVFNGMILGETTTSASECGSSTRGRENHGTDLCDEALEEYPESFVHWVDNEATLSY